jgi:hypothetical protein
LVAEKKRNASDDDDDDAAASRTAKAPVDFIMVVVGERILQIHNNIKHLQPTTFWMRRR